MALMTRLAALEDYDEMEDVQEPDNIAEATEIESSLIEAQEQEEELNDMESDVGTAMVAQDAMESLIVTLEEAVERGGMDRYEAKLYNLNRKTIYGMMGIDLSEKKLVSVESFSGSSSRLMSTKIALEEEKEASQSWWRKIVDFITRGWDYVVDFVKSFRDISSKLKKRSAELLKKAENSETKFEGTMKDKVQEKYGKIFRGPGVKDEVASLDNIIKHIDESTAYKTNIDKMIDTITKAAEQYKKAAEESKKDDSDDKKIIDVYIELDRLKSQQLKELGGNSAGGDLLDKLKKHYGDNDGKNDYFVLKECYGGMVLLIKSPKKEADSPATEQARKAMSSSTDSFTFNQELLFSNIIKVETSASKKFDITKLDKDACIKHLKDISSITDKMKPLLESINKFGDEFKKIKSMLSPSGVVMKVLKAVGNFFKSIFVTSNHLTKWFKYLVSLVKDVLNVIAIRMGKAKGDGKEEGDKEEKKTQPGILPRNE